MLQAFSLFGTAIRYHLEQDLDHPNRRFQLASISIRLADSHFQINDLLWFLTRNSDQDYFAY